MPAESSCEQNTIPELFAEIARLLADMTDADDGVPPEATLEGDLGLDSLDVLELAARLRERYGDRVDLLGFLATLDIDELVGLTAGDLGRHVADAAR